MDINFQDIIRVASGVDSEGNPNSGATLAIDVVKDEKPEPKVKTITNIVFSNATFDIKASGGSIVVVAEFPKDSKIFFNQASKILSEWMKDWDVPTNEVLSLTIVPFPFVASLSIYLTDLVYATSFEKQDKGEVIMVFDNQQTKVFVNTDVDYEAIIASVDAEIRAEEEALDNELKGMEEEIARLEKEEYNRKVKEDLVNSLKDDEEEEDEEDNSPKGIRFTSQDDYE